MGQLYEKDAEGWPIYDKPLDPTPARPESHAYAMALINMFKADQALAQAKTEVPDYIPVGSPKDFYSEEQEAWNRAADALADALKALV